jgi:hypothetical protein
MTETTKKQKADEIAARLLENAVRIRYGKVAAELNVHDGRIVDVTHTVTESMRERGEVKK